jgi:tetratricopeptide (TPR) repeat protein
MIRETILIGLLAAAPVAAFADAKTEAQVHIGNATKLHEAMKLPAALEELSIAYTLDPAPELLYAIGQIHNKLGNCSQAVVFYTRFLSTKPEAGPADEAHEAIAACPNQQRIDPKAEANRHVADATGLHEAGKFAAARGELVLAYTLDPAPELLYAIAQVEVKLDRCVQAVPYYERFLSTNPQAGPAADAGEAIEVCKKRAAEPKPTQPLTLPVAAQQAEPPWYSDKLGVALVGGGAVLEIVGIFTYRAAVSDVDKADRAATYSEHADLVDGARSKRTVAAVFAVGGLAAAGVGVWHIVVHHRSSAEKLAIVPTHDGGYVTWMGHF